jgi:hypothetical protein
MRLHIEDFVTLAMALLYHPVFTNVFYNRDDIIMVRSAMRWGKH